ncbi:MAG: hypothetical protein ACUVX8_00845 [Candidatus Zipacnadales bacterium]
MAETTTHSVLPKIVGLMLAGLVIAGSIILIATYRPALTREIPHDHLAIALRDQLPDSQPQVSGMGTSELVIELTVDFDPTIDADQAQTVFRRALATAQAEKLATVKTIEIRLAGRDLEGKPTSASRTFDYMPADKQP